MLSDWLAAVSLGLTASHLAYRATSSFVEAIYSPYRIRPTAEVVRIGYRLQRFIALTSLRASLARHT